MKNTLIKKLLSISLTVVLSLSLLPATTSALADEVNPSSIKASPIPSKILVGYWHNFENGTGTIKLRDVSPYWDVINLSFGEGTTVDSGDIRFTPFNATEEEFKEDVKYLQSQGKKVLISIGGEKGQVQLKTQAARDKFISSVSAIIDNYGLDGLDIDFEGHSLYFDVGDTDLKNPTTPVIVNLIYALKALKSKYADKFILTMAPETFFVQNGYAFYGNNGTGADPRCGAYLPVIYAVRDSLNWLQVQYYNSGPIKDLNGKYQTMGSAEFYVSLADMLLKGFSVGGKADNFFPALRPDQVVIGVPAAVNAGNGYVSNTEVQKAFEVLTKGGTIGGYTIETGYPELRGLMTWSINWDKFVNYTWSKYFRNYFNTIVPPISSLKAPKITSSVVSDKNYSLNIEVPTYNTAISYEIFENEKSIGTGSLKPDLTTPQTIKKDFTNKSYGNYSYKVVVKDNASQTKSSAIYVVEVKDPLNDPNKEDVNKDGKIDILDLTEVASKYNTSLNQSGYNVKFDINKDEIIDLFDLTKVASKFNSEITNPSISEWKTGTPYKLGDKVTFKGKTYECTYAHTSLDSWLPGTVPTLWKEII